MSKPKLTPLPPLTAGYPMPASIPSDNVPERVEPSHLAQDLPEPSAADFTSEMQESGFDSPVPEGRRGLPSPAEPVPAGPSHLVSSAPHDDAHDDETSPSSAHSAGASSRT